MTDFATAIYPVILVAFMFLSVLYGRDAFTFTRGGAEWQDLSFLYGMTIRGAGMVIDQAFWFGSRIFIESYPLMTHKVWFIGLSKSLIASGALFLICSKMYSSRRGLKCIISMHIVGLILAGVLWGIINILPVAAA